MFVIKSAMATSLPGSSLAPSAADAFKRFALENDISDGDHVYAYNNAEQQQWLQSKPWTSSAKYFKHVRISALALVKMVMHTRCGH